MQFHSVSSYTFFTFINPNPFRVSLSLFLPVTCPRPATGRVEPGIVWSGRMKFELNRRRTLLKFYYILSECFKLEVQPCRRREKTKWAADDN